ncbi:MAG: hypothetical protein ACE5FO_04785 [Parvularculaceae bacterium]
MGAKSSHILALIAAAATVAAVSGCSSLKRFAPPGFVKYEDRAGDQPMSPIIKERIKTRKKSGEMRFPKLSETPSKAPEPAPAGAREADLEALVKAGETLNARVAADRAASHHEREEGVTLPGEEDAGARPLDETRDALSAAVEESTSAARRERAEPMPAPDDSPDEKGEDG